MAEASPLWLADWPAPPGVRAFTTMRHGAGGSQPPFDTFNLGNRTAADGDDPAQVQRNRDELLQLAKLPSAAHWPGSAPFSTASHTPAFLPPWVLCRG